MAHEVKLGALIDDESQQRDAIHIAVAPVVAGERLYPGQEIGFIAADHSTVGSKPEKFIGIVDPFLTKPVQQGQRCWMFLFPQTITSLRHDWTHPEFGDMEVAHPVKQAAESWLREFAKDNSLDFDDLMLGAAEYQRTGAWYYVGDNEEAVSQSTDTMRRFWQHYGNYTGNIVDLDDGGFFRCAC